MLRETNWLVAATKVLAHTTCAFSHHTQSPTRRAVSTRQQRHCPGGVLLRMRRTCTHTRLHVAAVMSVFGGDPGRQAGAPNDVAVAACAPVYLEFHTCTRAELLQQQWQQQQRPDQTIAGARVRRAGCLRRHTDATRYE